MSQQFDVTGRWTGHYINLGQPHGIIATFDQIKGHVFGCMQDVCVNGEYSLFDAVFQAGLAPGTDEQIEARLREMVPDASPEPVRCIWQLPSGSILEGHCVGETVYFLKTYQGTSFSGFRIGDKKFGMEKAGHTVHYEGELSWDGSQIHGRWWTDAEPELDTNHLEGFFSLCRDGETEASAGEPMPASLRVKRRWWQFWSRPPRLCATLRRKAR